MKKQKKSSKKLSSASICKNSVNSSNVINISKNSVNNNNIMNNKLQSGITLIALVISIIVMLILAGVSINAIIGDNGILTQTQTAKFSQKIASYKEEMEMNIVGNSSDFVPEREKVTAINENIKQYIPSIEDGDVGKFGIIAGELYYLGTDNIEKQVAINQGLNTKSEDQSIEDFVASVENDALENIIKNMAGDSFKVKDEEGNEHEVGIALKNKGIGVANWKIITEVENGLTKATYGTNWYYVEKGAEIEGIGKLNSDYIINYKTGKAVKFDANKHTMLADGADLAVKDNIILKIDPSSIEKTTESFGENVQLIGFDDLSNAFTATSFIFDGVDDYIKIPYDDTNSVINGFSYEFYGKITAPGHHYEYKDGIYEEIEFGKYEGIFCVNNGNDRNQANIRFGIWDNYIGDDKMHFFYTPIMGTGSDIESRKFQFRDENWNMYPLALSLNYDTTYYITIVFDANENIQKIFLDGELIDSDTMIGEAYKDGVNRLSSQFKFFNVGRCSMSSGGWWHYMNSEVNALRLYNRGLTDDEVKANYNATVAYHNILTNGGSSETGGETEGEDIGNIE